jgi:hypothetical protein
MFKVIILLDCDECGHSFNKAAVCTPEQKAGESEMRFLANCAELHAWRFTRDYGICPVCIEEELKMVDWLQEPEDDIQI